MNGRTDAESGSVEFFDEATACEGEKVTKNALPSHFRCNHSSSSVLPSRTADKTAPKNGFLAPKNDSAARQNDFLAWQNGPAMRQQESPVWQNRPAVRQENSQAPRNRPAARHDDFPVRQYGPAARRNDPQAPADEPAASAPDRPAAARNPAAGNKESSAPRSHPAMREGKPAAWQIERPACEIPAIVSPPNPLCAKEPRCTMAKRIPDCESRAPRAAAKMAPLRRCGAEPLRAFGELLITGSLENQSHRGGKKNFGLFFAPIPRRDFALSRRSYLLLLLFFRRENHREQEQEVRGMVFSGVWTD